MSTESRELTLLSRAQRALAAAQTIDEFKEVRDLAEAARGYARRKKLARDVLLDVACLTIRAEHAFGTALRQIELAKAAPGNQYVRVDRSHAEPGPKYLRDLGITKSASHRAQLIALLPKQELDCWLANRCAEGQEPTLAGARQYALELMGRGRSSQPPSKTCTLRSSPVVQADEVTELREHHNMLDQLLSRIYDGGTAEFRRAEGRLVQRLLRESAKLVDQLAKYRRSE